MTGRRLVFVRSLVAAAMAGLTAVAPVDFFPILLLFWVLLAIRWRSGDVAGWAVPGAIALAIVLAAAVAPVETVHDRAMAMRTTVPKREMTVAELREPDAHGLARPTARYHLQAPAAWEDRVVRFPSLEPTVGEFIAAIESQAGLEHRFASCTNGWTILWGHDNITSLGFRPPRQ